MVSRLVDLPFTRGIDETTDDTVLAPPGMTELVNYRLTRAGRLEHRLGVVEQSISSVIVNSSGDRPDGNKTQALYQRFLAAGGHGYTCLASGAWACVGSLSRFVPVESYQGLQRANANYEAGTCASVNGFLVVAANNLLTSSTNIKIFDERTGAMVRKEDSLAGMYPRVIASGNVVVVVTQDQGTGSIQAASLDLSSLPLSSFAAPTVIVAASASSGFDAAPYDSTEFLISYRSTTFARIGRVTTATLALAASAGVNDGAGEHLTTCIGTPGEGYFLVWRNTFFNDVKFIALDTTLTQIGAPQTIATITPTSLALEPRPVVCRKSATTAIVGWTDSYESAPFATYRSTFRDITNVPALGTTYGPTYGVFIASKPFLSSVSFFGSVSQPAVWLGNYNPTETELDRSYFLMLLGLFSRDGDNAACTTELSASPSKVPIVDSLLGAKYQVSDVVESTAAGPRVWQSVFTEAVRGLGTATPQTGVQVYRYGDASRSVRARTRAIVPAQGSLAILGGSPRYYDTDRIVEIGMPHGPTVIDAAPDVTGSMTPSGTYFYVFLLEYYDGRGQRHLSYPSSPISVTLGVGDGQVNFEVLVPSVWGFPNTSSDNGVIGAQRARSVVLRAYRTSNNGTVFRYSPDSVASNGVSAGPLASRAQVQYQDVNSDADIAANEAVYVQVGNALSNYRAPPCRFGCEHEGRLIVAGGWDPSEYIASKTIFVGEGIQFTESASFRDVCPEPITGTASLDGSLILFAQRAIYVVSGDGPTDDGAGGFPKPRRLPGRIGCVDWRSVITTEAGVYFRAADGIYMLPRGLAAPQFVGAPIKGKLRLYPETLGAANVTRALAPAVSDHDSEQVLAWLVGDAEEPTAVKVYSYSLASGAWSEFDYPAEEGNLHHVIGPWFDVVNQTDVLGLARAQLDVNEVGCIQVENPASEYDRDISGTFEPLLNGEWRTGKVFPFGFGGRGAIRSIRLVGECLAATTLTPYIYSDAAPSGYASSALTFTAGRFAVEIPFRHKDIAWIQVGAVDPATGSGNRGAGLRFNGLALEVEMEPGLIRSTPGNRST